MNAGRQSSAGTSTTAQTWDVYRMKGVPGPKDLATGLASVNNDPYHQITVRSLRRDRHKNQNPPPPNNGLPEAGPEEDTTSA